MINPSLTPAVEETSRYAQLLIAEGEVAEVRVIRHNRYGDTAAGYFDNPEGLVKAAQAFDGKVSIYISLNPVNGALLSRYHNRIELKALHTTADLDVLRRRWLFIDIDPVRPAGISATQEEVDSALNLGEEIRAALAAMGWPEPVVCMSGNGCYLLYRIDLENTPEATALVKAVLESLAQHFDTAAVKVDTSVFNPARIIGLVGTTKVKGDSTPERPHRRSRIVSVPEVPAVVSEAQLSALAALQIPQEPVRTADPRRVVGDLPSIPDLLDRAGIRYRERPADAAGNRWWDVEECPYHGPSPAFACGIGVAPDGRYLGKCFHNQGQGQGWQAWKRALGLDRFFGGTAGSTVNVGAPQAAEDINSAETEIHPLLLLSDKERPLVARDLLVDRYIDVMSLRTDAPAAFHEAVSLSVLSVLLGRRACLKLTTGDVFPSIWLLIVGPSTRYRKTTSMRLGRRLLASIDPDTIAPSDFSPQRFVAVMAERDGEATVFFRDEISGFYKGLNSLDWMGGLKESLMVFRDGDPYRRELQRPKGKEVDESQYKFVVERPFLSILGGTTRDAFIQTAEVGDIANGFLPRFVFYLPDGPPIRRPVRELTQEDEDALSGLRNQFEALTNRDLPTIRLAPGVLQRWNELHERLVDADQDEETAIVHERMADNVLRIAVLLAGCSDCVISMPILFRAISILEARREGTIKLLRDIAPSKEQRLAQRVLDVVAATGAKGIARSSVMLRLRLSKRDMDAALETLEDRGQVVVDRVATAGRPGMILRATPLFMLSMLTNGGTEPRPANAIVDVETPREKAEKAEKVPDDSIPNAVSSDSLDDKRAFTNKPETSSPTRPGSLDRQVSKFDHIGHPTGSESEPAIGEEEVF